MLRVFGSKVYVSVFSLILFAVISLSVDAVFLYIALLGALMHEIAHLTAMKLCGARVVRISVYPFGADIKADTSALSYKSEILVAAAGPAVSFLLFLLSVIFFARCSGIYLLAFAVSNFLFFIVNILPVRGLDGARILLSLLLLRLDIDDAYRIYDIVSSVSLGVLCFLSFALLYLSGYNLSLVFICAYLFISGYVKRKCT